MRRIKGNTLINSKKYAINIFLSLLNTRYETSYKMNVWEYEEKLREYERQGKLRLIYPERD